MYAMLRSSIHWTEILKQGLGNLTEFIWNRTETSSVGSRYVWSHLSAIAVFTCPIDLHQRGGN